MHQKKPNMTVVPIGTTWSGNLGIAKEKNQENWCIGWLYSSLIKIIIIQTLCTCFRYFSQKPLLHFFSIQEKQFTSFLQCSLWSGIDLRLLSACNFNISQCKYSRNNRKYRINFFLSSLHWNKRIFNLFPFGEVILKEKEWVNGWHSTSTLSQSHTEMKSRNCKCRSYRHW